MGRFLSLSLISSFRYQCLMENTTTTPSTVYVGILLLLSKMGSAPPPGPSPVIWCLGMRGTRRGDRCSVFIVMIPGRSLLSLSLPRERAAIGVHGRHRDGKNFTAGKIYHVFGRNVGTKKTWKLECDEKRSNACFCLTRPYAPSVRLRNGTCVVILHADHDRDIWKSSVGGKAEKKKT